MLKAADQFTVPSRRQFEKCKARATAASTAAAPNIKRIMRERSLIGFSYFVVGEFNSILASAFGYFTSLNHPVRSYQHIRWNRQADLLSRGMSGSRQKP